MTTGNRPSTTGNRPVATVERAVAVLHALADSAGDLGNNEIARHTGINPSTVSRLLATLAQDELVTRVTDNRTLPARPPAGRAGQRRPRSRRHATALPSSPGGSDRGHR